MTEQRAIAFPALGISKGDSMSLWRSLDEELIDRDDEIMAQFVEADNLKTRVRATASFAGLVSVLTQSHAIRERQ